MRKHTPGPWKVGDNGDGTSFITAGRGCDVADTRAATDEPANARLIVAAPTLLDALKRVANFAVNNVPGCNLDDEVIVEACAAIALVEGGGK